MKRSLLLLATLALSSSLYAQTASSVYTREEVLSIFSLYNPSVLEKANGNADYNAVLEAFLSSYREPVSDGNRWKLIAVARNFDHSILLQALTDAYAESVLTAQMTGIDLSSVRGLVRADLISVFSGIWAVTVNLRERQLAVCQDELASLRRDKTLPQARRDSLRETLERRVRELKAEIKTLRKNPGGQIQSSAASYLAQLDREIARQKAAGAEAAAGRTELSALESSNLQIKSGHKKPVAE